MFLYSNIIFLIDTKKITGNYLAINSKIPQSTIVEIKTKSRELKGNQIHKIFTFLKKENLISTLDELFLKDLSKE